MKRLKARLISLIAVLLVSTFFLFGCSKLDTFYIKRVKELNLSIGDTYIFDKTYYSSDENVFKIENNEGLALENGTIYLSERIGGSPVYIINISNSPKHIDVEVDNILNVGESSDINVLISPLACSQSYTYEIKDESVVSIIDGKIQAKSIGYTDIIFKSSIDSNIQTEVCIIVQEEDEIFYEDQIAFELVDDSLIPVYSSFGEELNALTGYVKQSFVGISQYKGANLTDFGGGVLYKRNAILKDGTKVLDATLDLDLSLVKSFEYYVITTRNFALLGDSLKIYIDSESDEIEASIIQYDPKVDLALLKFETFRYFPLMKMGNSDEISQGEFVVSLSNSNGKDYFKTSTFGVISHTKRYVATDTDDDQTSDWDSEFIQHDASINSDAAKKVIYSGGDIYNYINGGALINLKGELIGLDSMKISSSDSSVNNMSLSIPVNLIKDIVLMLEQGIKPNRPLLGVTIFDVLSYYKNVEYYDTIYGPLNIPSGLEYGFYINEVSEGGVADMAHIQTGDILLMFNGVKTRYSYILRAELGKFIIGSGESTKIVVLRNGEEVTLTVTF